MNDQLFQQAEQFFKPITEMMALNARTFEALAEKQTGLMSDMWNDGINYARDLSDKRDARSFYASQKDYWDNVNQKLNSTARDSYTLLTEAQEEMGKLVQDSISSVDFQSAVEPFMQGAYAAQDMVQRGARTAEENADRASKATSRTAQSAQNAQSKATSQASEAAKGTAKAAQSAAGSSQSNANKSSSDHK